MITAIVQYKLPPHIDLDSCAAHFRDIAPGFRTVPGLLNKQFIYAEDGWAGGVYQWETRAAAQEFYAGLRRQDGRGRMQTHLPVRWCQACPRRRRRLRRR